MSTVTLVRHGQASFGSADYDRLSPIGVRQAQLLGAWWARCDEPEARVVCGSLRRHRDTAVACLEAWGLNAPTWCDDPGFDEFDHAEILARHAPELAEPDAIARFMASKDNPARAFQRLFAAAVNRWVTGSHDGEYRESWPAFKARCGEALDRAAALCAQAGPVVVFTSGGPIGVIVQRLLGIPDTHVFDLQWALVNAGVTRMRRSAGRLMMSSVNGAAHLEAAGDADLITYR